MKTLIYLNAIHLCECARPKQIFELLSAFSQDTERIWNAGYSELKNARISGIFIEKFIAQRTKIEPISEWEKLIKKNITLLPHPGIIRNQKNDHLIGYSELLTQIADPPALLYVKGNTNLNFPHLIAVVGSRKCTNYGKQAVNDIVHTLAINNIIIVSGFAFGIDILAHHAALKAKKSTIAVLAHGLDSIYPSMNTNSVQDILRNNGTLVSEFPLGVLPTKYNFPRRNRIISGLSNAALVIEAAKKSGSLITAYHALEQNRDVFAIPGSIYSKNSQGTNSLIQKGAKLIQTADDILEEFDLQNSQQYDTTEKSQPFSSYFEKQVFEHISHEPCSVDEIITKTGLAPRHAHVALTQLELKNMIQRFAGGAYCRTT